MTERGAQRDAAAEADNADLARVLVEEQRQVRDQFLRQHVATVRRVHLAVDGERQRSGEPLDRDRGSCPLAVVEQRAGLELSLQIKILRHVWRVEIRAAREERAIPRSADDRDYRGDDGGDCADEVRPRAQPAPRQDDRRRSDQRDARYPERRLKPTRGMNTKPASEFSNAPTVLTA